MKFPIEGSIQTNISNSLRMIGRSDDYTQAGTTVNDSDLSDFITNGNTKLGNAILKLELLTHKGYNRKMSFVRVSSDDRIVSKLSYQLHLGNIETIDPMKIIQHILS